MDVEPQPAVAQPALLEPIQAPHRLAKRTYGRKPLADAEPIEEMRAQEPSASSSSLSSLPSSPVLQLFDRPMRKPAAAGDDPNSDHQSKDDTADNTDVSPEQRGLAKFGRASPPPPRKRTLQRIASTASASSSGSAPAYALPEIGAARRIMAESDDDDDDDDNDEDDEAVLARVRGAAAVRSTQGTKASKAASPHSDLFSGSLSSAPPTSSQPAGTQSRSERRDDAASDDASDTAGDRTVRRSESPGVERHSDQSDVDDDDDDEDAAVQRRLSNPTRRRGAKVSAMKGRGGKHAAIASSDSEGEASVRPRKPKTFKLVSSSSVDETGAGDTRGSSSSAAKSRKEKMEALAAAKRKDAGAFELYGDADDGLPGLDPSAPRSRSRSLSIKDDGLDPRRDRASKPASNKHLELAQETEDLRAELDSDAALAPRKARSKSSKPKKAKLTGPKPLSKKEQENMFRETERLKREHRARLAPVEKKQITLTDLLSKINAGDQKSSARSADASSSQHPRRPGDDGPNHASDPIESDPIRDHERSSPASSPIAGLGGGGAMSAHPRRLGPLVQRRPGPDALSLQPVSQAEAEALAPGEAPDANGQRAPEGEGIEPRRDANGTEGDGDPGHPDSSDEDDMALPPDADQFRSKFVAQSEQNAKLKALKEMKLRLLAAQGHGTSTAGTGATKAGPSGDNDGDDDDDDLEIERGGEQEKGPASERSRPTTPGRRRPADAILREVGIKPTRTPRQSKTGTNAFGSPGMALDDSPGGDGDDMDVEDLVTDSQLRRASKAFAASSGSAAGRTPVRAKDGRKRASGQPSLTQDEFRATLRRRAQAQNMEVRLKKEALAKKSGHSKKSNNFDGPEDASRAPGQDVQAMLEQLQRAEAEGRSGARADADADDDVEDEDDPDFLMPGAEDAEDAIGSGSEIGGDRPLGSGSEVEDDDADDEVLVSDDEAQHDVHGAEQEEEDSEKENAPPASKAATPSRAGFSQSPISSQRPSRAVMDEDEDDAPGPRLPRRSRKRTALADDDDDDDDNAAGPGSDVADSDAENQLRPGRLVAATSTSPQGSTSAHSSQTRDRLQAQSQSQSQERVVLGDISAESLGHLSQPSQSGLDRRDSLAQGLNGDDSYRTDDISVGGFTQLFAPTQGPRDDAAAADAAGQRLEQRAPQRPADIWNMTQTQTSQSQGPSQSPSLTATRFGGSTASTHPGIARDDSVNSALGAFFEDTQSQMASESMDIFANPKNKDGMARGFTQFFGSTPVENAKRGDSQARGAGPAGTLTDDSQSQSQWDADRFSMPPPRSTAGLDGFAALRKAQMGEAMNLTPTPSLLPSLDESQAEREAEADQLREVERRGSHDGGNGSPKKKVYFNKDGFFTQTKPSTQQAAEWGMDSQSQTQIHTPLKIPSSSVGERTPLSPSLRRGNEAGRSGSSSDDDDDDEGGDAGSQSTSRRPRQLKRLRRGRTDADADDTGEPPLSQERRNGHVGDDESDRGDDDDEDDDHDDEIVPVTHAPPLGQGATRNAFDVLRDGAAHAEFAPAQDAASHDKRKKKSALVMGEAEESSDEEFGGRRRGDKSGLGRVFSDDERASGSEGDSSDDDDGKDLEELVDDEREEDEAVKDRLALEAYQADVAKQDEATRLYHEKAVRGDFRLRRKGRDGAGLDDFLDEDADEEELKRRAAQPRGGWYKKRRLDGDKDEMDELRELAEAQPFLKVYEGSHKPLEEGDYGFLAGRDDDDDEDDDDDDDDADRDEDNEEVEGVGSDEDDGDDDVATARVRTARHRGGGDDDVITHDAIMRELRERRKAQNRRGGRRLADPDYSSDEDEAERRIAAALRDRVTAQRRQEEDAIDKRTAQKQKEAAATRKTLGTTSRVTTYGKSKLGGVASLLQKRNGSGSGSAEGSQQPHGSGGAAVHGGQAADTNDGVVGDDDDDDDDEPMSIDLHLLLEKRRAAKSSSGLNGKAGGAATNAASAGGANDDDEPDWGNDGSLYRMSSRPSVGGAAGGASMSSSSSSASASLRTSSGAWKRKSASDDAAAGAERKRVQDERRKTSSVLVNKRLMSRESQFQQSL
ncbi:uncharacterized protein PFL1_03005 [Pseudozyma flocculosa PF-1]|uniref:DNA replication checkpoint mediator MRC1 domain-containing protein n=1 Tax=Pseudozyma flocculosa PF-1 TaxID=1277687 RepID=A0A061HB39_9BASI|nr:uncharacterized protein PFL1_03005 [Pseudozyma flocculosa PF-1]EPQ29250.1 hypothetical protein PFL1_03005 [Pseudozyma flocculosa PF-1]